MAKDIPTKIAWHYTPHPRNYDLKNKSTPKCVPFVTAHEIVCRGQILSNEKYREGVNTKLDSACTVKS